MTFRIQLDHRFYYFSTPKQTIWRMSSIIAHCFDALFFYQNASSSDCFLNYSTYIRLYVKALRKFLVLQLFFAPFFCILFNSLPEVHPSFQSRHQFLLRFLDSIAFSLLTNLADDRILKNLNEFKKIYKHSWCAKVFLRLIFWTSMKDLNETSELFTNFLSNIFILHDNQL